MLEPVLSTTRGLEETSSAGPEEGSWGCLSRDMLAESGRWPQEAGTALRRCALKASRAAEAEAVAVAKSRGLEERQSVLEALALTLDANAARLAREEARTATRNQEAEALSRSLEEQARRVEAAEAEQRATSRWLRREAAEAAQEEEKRVRRFEAAEAERRDRESTITLAEAAAASREARSKELERWVATREERCAEREARCEEREKALAAAEESADEVARGRAKEAREVEARAADVDARAHAVASADAVAKERAAALAERAEALAAARDEIEKRAESADERAKEAEVREAAAKRAEAAAHDATLQAREAQEKAEADRERASREVQAAREARTVGQRELDESAEASLRQVELRRGELATEAERIEAQKREVETRLEEIDALKKAADEAMAQAEATKVDLAERTRLASEREATWKEREAEMVASTARAQAEIAHLEAARDEANRARDEAAETEARAKKALVAADELVRTQRAKEGELEALASDLREREQSLDEAASLDAAPWLLDGSSTTEWERWEDVEWLRGLARAASKEQKAAHDAARLARKQARAVGSSEPPPWDLLPREVRANLRAGVALGDRIRKICTTLQAALVRRFLRLCAFHQGTALANDDAIVRETLAALRGVASQEVVRRRRLVEAIFAAKYAVEAPELARLAHRPAPRFDQTDLFRLRHNHFDNLKLRLPAAKARFSAAAGKWSEPAFKRFLFDRAAKFNGAQENKDRLALATDNRTKSANDPVYFRGSALEVDFGEKGDDGRYAPRAACVFEKPRDLLDFFRSLDDDPDARCLGVANGFASVEDDEPDHDHPHEVAVALDLHHQGLLCDLRLRLKALDQPQCHLDSLSFLANVHSHEQILLPIWRDFHADHDWISDDLNHQHRDDPPPPPYQHRSHTMPASRWPAPPEWKNTFG